MSGSGLLKWALRSAMAFVALVMFAAACSPSEVGVEAGAPATEEERPASPPATAPAEPKETKGAECESGDLQPVPAKTSITKDEALGSYLFSVTFVNVGKASCPPPVDTMLTVFDPSGERIGVIGTHADCPLECPKIGPGEEYVVWEEWGGHEFDETATKAGEKDQVPAGEYSFRLDLHHVIEDGHAHEGGDVHEGEHLENSADFTARIGD